MQKNVSFLKYLLVCAVSFGIGGAIWGYELYAPPSSDYPLDIFAGILLGIFGALGLNILSKDIKQILKTIGLGVIGGIIGVFIAFWWSYPLLMLGTSAPIVPNFLVDFIKLMPHLKVGAYWLNFAVAGIFIGLFFAIALKTKIWPMVWRGAAGFGLAAIISPIIGNIAGNLLNSLFITYIVTFALIGAVLGKFLGWGAYKGLKS